MGVSTKRKDGQEELLTSLPDFEAPESAKYFILLVRYKSTIIDNYADVMRKMLTLIAGWTVKRIDSRIRKCFCFCS